MRFGTIICLFLLCLQAAGQITDNNDIICQLNKPLTISYNSIEEVGQEYVIRNAIELKLYNKEYARTISASIAFTNIPQNKVPDKWVSIRLASHNSPSAIIHNYETFLSTSPAVVFMQPSYGNGKNSYCSFYYDIVIHPLSKFIMTGNYDYHITFTTAEQ